MSIHRAAVQNGFCQPVALVAELQRKKRRMLPHKAQENAVPLPLRQGGELCLRDPRQLALVAVPGVPRQAEAWNRCMYSVSHWSETNVMIPQ